MSRMEELNRYKRINSVKPLNRLSKDPVLSPHKNIQPVIHKNTKIIANEMKFVDFKQQKSEHPTIHSSTFKKLPIKTYKLQRQTTIDEIKKTDLENTAEHKIFHPKDFQNIGVYEIKSYQLVEVNKKETQQMSTTEVSNRNLDLCQKSAKQAAKFFHLAKIHKNKQVSNPYMKFLDKVVKNPPANKKNTLITKSKLPTLENGELQEMMNFMGIEVSTQTEKTSAIYWITKKNAMLSLLLILLLSNVLLLFALGLNVNCKLNDPFPSLQIWQKFYGFFDS